MNDSKPNSHYTSFSNVLWMFRQAKKSGRSFVVYMIIPTILVNIGNNITGLFISPLIIECIESNRPISHLIFIIGSLTFALMLFSSVNVYIMQNSLFGRIDIRTNIIRNLHKKFCITSYPNTENPIFLQKAETATHATQGNDQATEAIWTSLTHLGVYLICFIIYMILLANANIYLFAISLITTVVENLVNQRIYKWGYYHRSEAAEYEKKLEYICSVPENIALGKDVRLFGMQNWISDIYINSLKLYDSFISKRERIYIWTNLLSILMTFLRNGAAYFYLIRMTFLNNLPASQFILLFSAIGGFTYWVSGIMSNCVTISKQSLDISTIREFLDYQESFQLNIGQSHNLSCNNKYTLELHNVSFRYPNSCQYALKSINLKISPGEKVAVVGNNGAGKTTLVKLLCGLYDPTIGEVKINGVDIRNFNRGSYYSIISAVLQQSSILDVSIAENISLLHSGYDEVKIWDCLVMAGLSEKVLSLPKGIYTHIGRKVFEDGIDLSGGEIQRLLLARALYKDTPILLLDEPTSSLDPMAERDIYQKYHDMVNGKTSLFISHRLASTRFCDRIIVIENGMIVESGTHDSLITAGGKYAHMFSVQRDNYQ